MNLDDEYIHYRQSIDHLNYAWSVACELEKAEPLDLSERLIWSAAYRGVVVEYCKPFTNSRSATNRRLKISPPDWSIENSNLHERLVHLRDTSLAHTDLSELDATVIYKKYGNFPEPMLLLNTAPAMPAIADIRKHIEVLLDSLYEKQELYNDRYAQNP
jgi:hypothetical protein